MELSKMTFREVFKLSHREFTAYRTRSVATIITIGALFGLLLSVLFIVQGLENVALRYAKDGTDGFIYLATSYERSDKYDLLLERLGHYRGEIVTLSPEQQPNAPELSPSTVVARFANLSDAYGYASKYDTDIFQYRIEDYGITELFSNQVSVYSYFRGLKTKLVRPISLILIVVSIFILAFTMAHLLSGSAKTFVLYRAIGASKTQILLIYFIYLVELCIFAALFAFALALFLTVLVTVIGWNYFSSQFAQVYPTASTYPPILLGFNWSCLAVLATIFLAAPCSFLLCLDQFSNQKFAQKLKGD